MSKPRSELRCAAVAAATLIASLSAGHAWALSFGPVRAMATMGQPLDASIELALQPGEMPSDACVTAQVNAGDTPLPASQVSAQLIPGSDGSARVRVRTSVAIDEPFLVVTLGVGCDVRFARQFTVFADPPALAAVLSSPPVQQVTQAAPSLESRPVSAPAAQVAAAAPRPLPSATSAGSAAQRASSGEVRRAARAEPSKPVQVPPNRARAEAVAAAEPAAPAAQAPSPTNSEQRITSGAVSRNEGVARLKLDTPTVSSSTKEEALMRATQQREDAMATAKIAVDVAEAANSSAAQKIAELEAQLAAARKELLALQSALARTQAERVAVPTAPPASAPVPAVAAAAVAEEPWYSDLSPQLLAGAGAALLLLLGAIHLRRRRANAQQLQGWLNDPSRATSYSEFDTVGPTSEQFPLSQYSVSPATIPAYGAGDDAGTGSGTGAAGAAREMARPALAPARRLDTADAVTVPAPLAALSPRAASAAAPASNSVFAETQPSTSFDLNPISRFGDISIEELLDVEQQAEFFVVLGQDDAAIELLTNHVMATGGASPMPFLKLLEIYRRTGDQTSYERTRKRFNARFNGVAPEWGADPNSGRGLVDYPEVLARIERNWSHPVDAMAELQTLMFRNDSNLLFELPAYRDIMMLFTLARDHHEGRVTDSTPVDVLLPLKSQTSRGDRPALPELPSIQAAPAPSQARPPNAPTAMDENLRMALEDPSATVQVSVRRR